MAERILSPFAALELEFGTHYLADELDVDWIKGVAHVAWGTAVRLKRYVGEDQVDDLIALIQAAREDPSHEVIPMICDGTLVEWGDEPKQWHDLQQLLDMIVVNLKDKNIYDLGKIYNVK